jgi:hypothetical protein
MKSYKEFVKEKENNDPCWKGYKQLGMKKKNGKKVPNCVPEEALEESEYEGKKITLNKPFRVNDGKSKFAVYVKNDNGNVVKVRFGDPEMSIKKDDPERRKAFRARHNCDTATDKTSRRYWSCRSWSDSEDWV